MLKIFVARHGQDLDNVKGILNGRRDMPLSEKGIEQAGLVAAELQQLGIKFDKVYASPLQRAFRTAEVIADMVCAPAPEILDDLIERDFGVMTGKHRDEIESTCAPDVIKTDTIIYFLCPTGAETFPQLVERARKVLRYIREKHTDGNVLLVTHGDIGKMIYCAYYNLDWQEILPMFHFGNSEILILSEDSEPDDVYLVRTAQYNA